ncbi:MAG: COG1361 S-layer family protein [Methanomicrobia archaeon]|nr:COG1361 S-layer family protein [Methanomicrobia archaeon]
MIRELCRNNMKTVLALCCIVAVLACLVAPISAGTDATVVIANVKPIELLPGETKTLTVTLQNGGSYDAKHVTLNFQENQYISVVGSSSVYAGSINGWSSKDVTVTVHVAKGAPSGSYAITATCSFDQYYSEGGTVVSETMPEVAYSIMLSVAQGAIIDIAEIVPTELKPGELTALQFTIANIGSYPLEDIVFSWTEANGVILPVNSDNTKHISHIGVGESVVVEYLVAVDVGADAGLYQLDLTLEFEDESGGSSSMSTTAGIIIGGGTTFDITLSESSDSQVSLYVANTGNNPAYSVTVKIPEQDQFRAQGSSASIVGNLDTGDYTIVSFDLTSTGPSAFGVQGPAEEAQMGEISWEDRERLRTELQPRNSSMSNNLLVTIEYTDATGVRQSVEKVVPVQLQTASSDTTITAAGPGGRYPPGQQQSAVNITTVIGALALVAIICAGVLFYRYKKRKAKNAMLTGSVEGKIE